MSAIRKRTRTITEWACICQRCGYSWTSEGPTPPKQCAKCKARGWDKPARPYRRRE